MSTTSCYDAMSPTWVMDEQSNNNFSPTSLENKDPNTLHRFSPKPPNPYDSLKKPSSSIRKSMRVSHDASSPTQDQSFNSPIQNVSFMTDDSLMMNSDSKKSNPSQKIAPFSLSPLDAPPTSFPRRKVTLQSMENELAQEIEKLRVQTSSQQILLNNAQKTIQELQDKQKENECARLMSLEDCQSKDFFISLQAQRIDELEKHLNVQKMDHHERLSKRSRKHSQAMKKLQQEKVQFEQQANEMMQQMTEQMNQLQSTAMLRIAVSILSTQYVLFFPLI